MGRSSVAGVVALMAACLVLEVRVRVQAPMTTGTAAISGVTVDGRTNQPLPGVVVYLGPPNHGPVGQPIRQITDAKGRFVFGHLPAWKSYFINASKAGYFDGHYGRSASGQTGAQITVADGQWVRDLRIVMNRGGSISGTVLDDRGEPIVGAPIRVLAQIMIGGQLQVAAGPVGSTDDRGVYRIAQLPAGTYVVAMPSAQNAVPASTTTAALAGFGPIGAAAREAAGRPVAFPDPVVSLDNGTDLVVGRYPVPPASADGRPRIYPVTFFPNTTTIAAATSIALNGDDRTGIDLRVSPISTSRLSGAVDGPPESYEGLTLRLMSPGSEDLGGGSEVATALVGAGGRFTFPKVPPGAYVINARRAVSELQTFGVMTGGNRYLPSTPATTASRVSSLVFAVPPLTEFFLREESGDHNYWARQRVTVEDRDVTDVVVTMRRAATLTAQVLWDGTRPSGGPGRGGGSLPNLNVLPARGSPWLGLIRGNADPATPERLRFEGLLPGEYTISSVSEAIKSIVCGGRDYTYLPLDASGGHDVDCTVTLTDKASLVTGTVRDEQGRLAAETAVVVFPAEREQWGNWGLWPKRVASIQTSTAGAFWFQELPGGDYFLAAVPLEFLGAWQDPKFLEAVEPLATRVHIAWGQNAVQDLTRRAVKWPARSSSR